MDKDKIIAVLAALLLAMLTWETLERYKLLREHMDRVSELECERRMMELQHEPPPYGHTER